MNKEKTIVTISWEQNDDCPEAELVSALFQVLGIFACQSNISDESLKRTVQYVAESWQTEAV